MTSTTGVGKSAAVPSHSAQRDFLLQRLMEDSQRLRGSGEGRKSPVATNSLPRSNGNQRRRKGAPLKNGTGSSSSTTPEDTDRTDSEENEDNMVKAVSRANPALNFQKHRQQQQSQKMFSSGLQLFNNPLHQYAAATLAAQFMQAAAGFPPISGHPPTPAALLEQYPLLYRSLFPASAFGNGLGGAPSSILPPSESPENGTKESKTPSKVSTPGTTEKRMASITLASPKQTQSTPSPRKRPPPKIKDSAKVQSPAAGSGAGTPKKARAIRRIQFDDEMCSPVSGMYIKDLDECNLPAQSPSSQEDGEAAQQLGGALDDSALWVKVTEEAKAELAKIPNVIGDYICRLCKVRYSDAFQLAKHRCPRIAHEEYRCPECDKVFSCPANLASHRRWHKPKDFVNTIDPKHHDEERVSTESIEQSVMDSTEDLAEAMFPSVDAPIDLSSNRYVHNGNGSTNGNGTSNGNGLEDHDNDDDDDETKSQTAQAIVSTPTYHECQTCGKRFDAHRWLRAHAVVHTNFNKTDSDENGGDHESSNGDEVQCPETGCQLWFLSADALEKHQRRAHPKFVCKFCSQSFPTSPGLTRHINRHHPASVADCRVILLNLSPPSRA